jgi:hypothetical protein
MRRIGSLAWIVLILAMLVAWPNGASAQGGYQVVTGKEFDSAMPRDFYLEGSAIPTQKRNAALVKSPAGARALFALIDTTGYSSHIQQKYEGMLITEGEISVCGNRVGVGSYGFGYTKPVPTSTEDSTFTLYSQAGGKQFECNTKKDAEIKQPKPLQVVGGEPAKLYLGRFWLELK